MIWGGFTVFVFIFLLLKLKLNLKKYKQDCCRDWVPGPPHKFTAQSSPFSSFVLGAGSILHTCWESCWVEWSKTLWAFKIMGKSPLGVARNSSRPNALGSNLFKKVSNPTTHYRKKEKREKYLDPVNSRAQ